MGIGDILTGISNVLIPTGVGLQGGNVTAVLEAQRMRNEKMELQSLLGEHSAEIKADPKKYYELTRDFYIQKGNLDASMQATQAIGQMRQAEKGKRLEEAGIAMVKKEEAKSLYTPDSAMYNASMGVYDKEIQTKLAQGGATGELLKMLKEAEKTRTREVEMLNKQQEIGKLNYNKQMFTDALFAGDMNAARKTAVDAGLKPNEIKQLFSPGTAEFKAFGMALDQQQPGLSRIQKMQMFKQDKFNKFLQEKQVNLQYDMQMATFKGSQKERIKEADRVRKQQELEKLNHNKQLFVDALYSGNMNAARESAVGAGLKPTEMRQLFSPGPAELKAFETALDQQQPGLSKMEKLQKYKEDKFNTFVQEKQVQLEADLAKKAVPQVTITKDTGATKQRQELYTKLDLSEEVLQKALYMKDLVATDRTGMYGFIKGTYEEYLTNAKELMQIPVSKEEFDAGRIHLLQASNDLLNTFAAAKRTGRLSNQAIEMFQKAIGTTGAGMSATKLNAHIEGIIREATNQKKFAEDRIDTYENMMYGDTKRIDMMKKDYPTKESSSGKTEQDFMIEFDECTRSGKTTQECISFMDRKYR